MDALTQEQEEAVAATVGAIQRIAMAIDIPLTPPGGWANARVSRKDKRRAGTERSGMIALEKGKPPGWLRDRGSHRFGCHIGHGSDSRRCKQGWQAKSTAPWL
jgi:hypothetical protein